MPTLLQEKWRVVGGQGETLPLARKARAQRADLPRQRRHSFDDRSPQLFPLLEGWEMAGWTSAEGGAFYDWFPLATGELAVVVAEVNGRGDAAAIDAASLRAMLRSHAESARSPAKLLSRVNQTLWRSSPGDKLASVVCLGLDEPTGRVRYAHAGAAWGLRRARGQWRPYTEADSPLGLGSDVRFGQRRFVLPPGGTTLLCTEALGDSILLDSAKPVAAGGKAPLRDLVASLRDGVPTDSGSTAVLALRRHA